MPDSWDWIEREKRRQRRMKLVPLVILLTPLLFVFYALDRMSLLPSGGSQTISTVPSEKPVEFAVVGDRQDQPSTAASPVSSGEVTDSYIPSPRVEPTPAQEQAFDSVIESRRANIEPAFDSADTITLQQSKTLEARYEALQRAVEKLNASESVSELLKFRAEQAETSPTRLAMLLGQVTPRQWLELAESEIEKASPDIFGFAEAWLPVASAWSILGNELESREAMRRVREAIPRMTIPERQVNMVIDLINHELFDRRLLESLFQEAVASAEQVSERFLRRTCYANLSGLAATLGKPNDAARLLAVAVDPEEDAHISTKIHRDDLLIYHSKAAAWSKKSEEIESIALELERFNGPHQHQVAASYAYAAMAAARGQNMQQFYRTIFKAESAFAPENFRNNHKYGFGVRLGDAYVLARLWQNAVIIANNVPDPNLQASILFRVLAESPQHVPAFSLPNLFEEFGDCRWASYGIAGYVEHRLRSGNDAVDVLEWIRKLENPALRGAAYTGVARSADVFANTPDPEREPVYDITKPDVTNLRSLVEHAQDIAVRLDDPLESAYGWLEVARTWRLIQREKGYQDAILAFHDCCFAKWGEIWKQRPPASRGYDGSYHDEYSRRHAVEQDEIARLIECERHLAELQVKLGDADGALFTCLRIANHAGFIDKPVDYVDWQFIFVECLLKRIQSKTGVGPEVLLPRRAIRTPYLDAMALAWSSETSRLQTQIEQMRAKEKADKIARASAELAILHATQGDLDRYRVARRGAFSEISRSSNSTSMKSVLAVADAIAGEFALAKDNIVDGEVAWFDGRARPRSLIAMGLAQSGSVDEAIEQAKGVSVQSPFYRSQAWRVIAESRFKGAANEDRNNLVDWANSLENAIDQVGALCGLTLAAESER